MSKIWRMIRKLKGTNKDSIKHITKEDGNIAETEKEIANKVAKKLTFKSIFFQIEHSQWAPSPSP